VTASASPRATLTRLLKTRSTGAAAMQLAAAALFEQTAELVWAIDQSFRLTAANPSFRAFLVRLRGVEPALGASMWHEGPPMLAACCERALKGELVQIDLVWGGQTFELSVAPLLEGARLAGALIKARDVTAARNELSELRRCVATLEAQRDELTLYAQQVAHDLKNPLTGITMSSKMLRKRMQLGLYANAEQLIDCISELSARGVATVEELLQLAREGHRADQLQQLDLAALVADVCGRFAPLIQARGARVRVAEQWPEAVGQPALVTSIWENYLSNALKYGGEAPRIELGARVEADGRVRCWVSDSGPGLTPAEQALLFAPFVRLSREGPGGHGLGLALVRHNSERMGGSAGVYSAPGQGACFFFLLPQARRAKP
jgi:signal transduction histidine kinase